jgi:dsDNA-specific endonuclease/ATPase MutS2
VRLALDGFQQLSVSNGSKGFEFAALQKLYAYLKDLTLKSKEFNISIKFKQDSYKNYE